MKKQSRVVVLTLSPSILSQFLPKSKTSSSSNASTPAKEGDDVDALKPTISIDNASDSNSTPAPGQDGATPDGSKKRKAPGTAPRKSLMSAVDTMPKPRGKPGPKKKPRLEDGTIDHGNKPAPITAAAHKLGPKANTGAINAGLRALDRSGAPCRKWDRKGFQLKSFTGIVWELSSWKGDERSSLPNERDGESISDNRDVSMHSSSDVKPNGSDVAMSNAGDQLDSMIITTPTPSSPAPVLPTAVAA